MEIHESILFYLMVGGAVAIAVVMSRRHGDLTGQLFYVVTATLFWPLYLPLLLISSSTSTASHDATAGPPCDAMASRIGQAEVELDSALASLDGWAGSLASGQRRRLGELKSAWLTQAHRIREIDRLLALSHASDSHSSDSHACDSRDVTSRRPIAQVSKSERARRENVARLRVVRARSHAELNCSLDRARELVSMIHLAKFTGAPASRAEHLIAELFETLAVLTGNVAECDET